MRLLPVSACAAVVGAVVWHAAPRESAPEPSSTPQPIGITAALLMNARLTDARSGGADNLPVPHNGRGPRVAVGDARAAQKIGARYFVPTPTLLRTTPLTFAAPQLEIAPREVWKSRTKFRIIDVREAEEFQSSHIPGSARRSMFENFADDTKPVALFCLTGHRSAALVQQLHARGVKNVFSVRGGWLDWQAQKLPLQRTVEFDRTRKRL
jgi:rhodanese-related sulfurtransferase